MSTRTTKIPFLIRILTQIAQERLRGPRDPRELKRGHTPVQGCSRPTVITGGLIRWHDGVWSGPRGRI